MSTPCGNGNSGGCNDPKKQKQTQKRRPKKTNASGTPETVGGLEQDRRNSSAGNEGFTSVNRGRKRPVDTSGIDHDEPAASNSARAPKKPRLQDETLVPNMDWLGGLDPNAAPRSGDPINRRSASIAADGEEIAPSAPGRQEGGLTVGVGAGEEELSGLPPTEQGVGSAADADTGGDGYGGEEISREELDAAQVLMGMKRRDSGR